MATIMLHIPYDDYNSRVVVGTIVGGGNNSMGKPCITARMESNRNI